MALKLVYSICPNAFDSNNADWALSRNRADGRFVGSRDVVQTPKWRAKIKAGQNATSPYECNLYEVKVLDVASVSATCRSKKPNGSFDIYKCYIRGFATDLVALGLPHLFEDITPAQSAQALSNLYGKIKADQQQLSGLTFLGELKETLHMLRHPAQALRSNTEKYLNTITSTRKQVNRKVRQRKGESPKQYSARRANAVKDAVAGSWLEYVYGVVPVMSDIEDIFETFSRSVYDERRTSVSAASSKRTAVQVSNSSVGDSFGVRLWTTYRRTTTGNCFYKAGIRAVASAPSSVSRFAELAGFSLREVVPTAYELLPYSFLIGYFSNLGDVIEAAFTDTSLVFWATRTTRIQTEVEVSEVWLVDTLETRAAIGAWHGQKVEGQPVSLRIGKHTTVSRTDSMPLPLPSLTLKIPGSGSTQWVNIAALLAQSAKFRFKG